MERCQALYCDLCSASFGAPTQAKMHYQGIAGFYGQYESRIFHGDCRIILLSLIGAISAIFNVSFISFQYFTLCGQFILAREGEVVTDPKGVRVPRVCVKDFMAVPGKIHDKHVRGFFMKAGLSQAKIPQKMDRYGKSLSFSLSSWPSLSFCLLPLYLSFFFFFLSVCLSRFLPINCKFSRVDVEIKTVSLSLLFVLYLNLFISLSLSLAQSFFFLLSLSFRFHQYQTAVDAHLSFSLSLSLSLPHYLGKFPRVLEFYCTVCDLEFTSAPSLQQHLAGRNHLK